MPATPWGEIPKGQRCEMQECTNYATHAYGDIWLCCDCHVGEKDGGLVTNAQATVYHEGA